MDHSKQAAGAKLVRISLILAGLVFAATLAFTPRPASTAGSGAPLSQAGAWQATLVFTHTNIVDSVAWSPDGSKIATGDRDGNLRVWDAATGASLLTMSGHDGDVTRVAWSPDGSKIAAVTDGSDNAAASWHGSVLIWDAATGANLHTLTGHTARLDSVSWSPDGAKVVSASPIDESVRVWDAATGANLLTLTLPSSQNETSVAWSPDGTKLASTTNDKSILVWDSATGDTLLTLTGDTGTPSQLAWSPDGSKIAAGSFDRHMRVWDATTGDNLLTIKQDGVVGSVAWSPDGSKIASRMSEADTGSPAVNVWDATTGAALQTWSTVSSYAYPVVLWSPDGSKIAAVTWEGDVLIWDAATGASLATLTDHGGEVLDMAWSPDGSRLASASGDETVRVWAEAASATSAPTNTPAPTAAPASTPTDTPAPTATSTSTPTGTPDPNALAFEPPSLEFVWVKGSRSNPPSQQVLARNASGKTGWHPSSWANDSGTKWVPGGLQMNISVSPANANLDVGVHESQFVLNSNGMTITLPVKVTVVSPDGKLEVNRKQLNFGGFVGDPIADQVVGLTFTGLNSTNWTASGPSWLTLAPASGSVAATAPSSLTVGIDAAAISAAGRYTGALTVSDGKTTHEIVVDLSQVAPGSPTIQLFGLEVTQGIQNLLNDVPFVAERPVFVRGHVRSLTGQPIEKVTAQLIGARDGVDLGTLNPTNPGGAINIVADPNRARLNESFLFELPPSWRTGTVTLRIVGQSQPIACVDPAEKSSATAAADDCTVTLTYETIPALPIKYFLYSEQGSITYSGGERQSSMTFTANADHAAATSQQLLAGLPIPRVDPQIHGTVLTFPGVRDGAAQSRMDRIMATEHEKAGKPSIHFYGLFARYKPATDPKAQVQGGPGGVAAVPGFSGFGEYYTFQPMDTLNMHEIGHNLGRNHVGCAAPGVPYPANPDSAYPYPDQRISDELSGDEAYYGFNIVDRDIYPPTYKDYMSYCWPKWISPYTYKAMMERLKIHYNPPAGGSGAGQAAASPGSPLLLVSGSISGATAGSIDSVVDDTAGAAIPAPDASDYSVRLEDASGQTIATYPVTAQLAQGQNHEDLVGYTLAVLRPENLARVVLLYQDQELAARSASANAPALTLTAPVGGESLDSQPLAITWDASDADGDALTFNVDYSTDDGATWQKLAWGWPETTLEVDGARLPGSAQARIRVAANDGFLTTFAVSEAFTVADHPPVATILTTNLNRYYVGGQTILLEGVGYDAEDGMVSDLTWHSDRGGVLGVGPTLSLNADDLVEGAHLIRLEAKDSAGQSSFGDPTLGIASADSVAVNDTVSFDVLYDPLTLPAEPVVARIQAESGAYAGDAASADIYGGFDGTGFAAYLAAAESAVQLDANVAAAGTYDLNIRYAAGPDGPETDRTISLYVNGSKLRQLAFGRTFDWAEWADLATSIDLNAGDNTIEFRVDSDDTGYINIDYIDYVAGEGTSDEPAAPESQVEVTGALPELTSTDGAPTAEAAEEPTPEAPAQADGFPLRPGQAVEREQKIPSESGNHYLIFQPDGNVVVYTAGDQYVWGLQNITDAYTRTQSVQVENDGNFVVRDANGEHIWSALNENPDPSAYLTLTPEGVLRLVSGDSGATLWASDGDLSPVAPTAEPAAEETAEPAGDDAHSDSIEQPATVTDGDGNVYPTVQVGDQLWMAQNLRTATCSDGAAIPLVSDKDAWVALTDAAYTWGSDVADDAQAQADYGALYNAHAAALPCNVCPSGWRVPSQADFQALLDSQGADAHLNLSDPAFWGPDSQATNASGWSARPAGGDGGDTPGSYDFGQFAYFWSTTPNTEDTNYLLVIHGADANVQAIAGLRYGYSIRCVQDLPPAGAPAAAAHAVHWAYEGEAGPENWGELDEAYEHCSAGLEQSPIDITTPEQDDLTNLVIAYRPSPLRVRNNGHTVVANYAAGSYIEVDGQRYAVDSLHYHSPSEHIVDGQTFAAELHIVHRQGKDLAVIGILLQEGAENPAYQALLDNLPDAEGPAVNTGVTFNAADLLPEVQTTYRYSGSLTTPPCSEGVRWLVMTTPVELSADQLAAFQAVFTGNARPVQPLNEREMVEDTTP